MINPYLKRKERKSLGTPALHERGVNIEEAKIHESPSTEISIHMQENEVVDEVDMKQRQNFGRNVSFEKRLPSRTVSFQSAEHLSVSELRIHQEFYRDRSVRVSGVILHRYIVETDASVCFVLGDVQEDSKPKFRIHNMTPSKNELISSSPTSSCVTPTTPAKPALKTLGPAKTPIHRRNMLGERTPLNSLTSLSSKRKVIHVSRTPGGDSSSLPLSKRRLSFSTSAENAIIQLSSEQTFLVIVNPLNHPQVSDCGVGDAVMVLGEVAPYNPIRGCNRAESFLSTYYSHLQRNNVARNEKTISDLFYLIPRVLRNINGTNIKLQYEATLLRRLHVLKLTNDPDHPGCGPPKLVCSSSTTENKEDLSQYP
jgi:hypothetical protein